MVDQIKRLGTAALAVGLLLGGIYGWLYTIVGLLYVPNKQNSVEGNRYALMRGLFAATLLLAAAGIGLLTITDTFPQSTRDIVVNVFGTGLAAGLPAYFIGVGNPATNEELAQRIRINAILGLALAIGGLIYIA